MAIDAGCVGFFTGAEDTPANTFPATPVPNYPYEETTINESAVHRAEDGSTEAARGYCQPRKLITLRWGILEESDLAGLWTFYVTVKGPALTFKFNDPVSAALVGNFRFVEMAMSKASFGTLLWESGLDMVQVFEYTPTESGCDYADESAFGSLTFPVAPIPQFVLDVSQEYRALLSTIDVGGAEQRRAAPGWTAVKQAYRLTWGVLNATDVGILWDFFVSTHGRVRAFTFKDPLDPTSSLGTFRFATDVMSKEMFAYQLWTTGLDVVEA